MTRILNNNKRVLTEGQQHVLSYIIEFTDKWGSAPTQQEIADHIKSSRQNAQRYLDVLVQKGYIKREGRKYRNIKLRKVPA